MSRPDPAPPRPASRPRPWSLVWSTLAAAAACGGDPPDDFAFPQGFRFGAATSAHQIEGGNTANDWHQFETLEAFRGATAEPSGGAADGYARFAQDADLAAALGLDVYRLSIEWSRVEPERGRFDEGELAHYREVLAALRARGLTPSVTLHHFTSPIWVQDLRDVDCAAGPSDANLCGWSNPEAAIAFAAFAERIAAEYGDLVDEWVTLNEPNVLVLTGFVFGAFPPGRVALDLAAMRRHALPALRTTIDAHVRGYRAVHAADGADADGDGVAARVGLAISTSAFSGASDRPEDVAAAGRAAYFYNHYHADAIAHGGLDHDLDGEVDEQVADWSGAPIDFWGVQYYTRIPVLDAALFAPVNIQPCVAQLAAAPGCPSPPRPEDVTQMGYAHDPGGLSEVIEAFAARTPQVPLLITENGIATRSGRRRAQSVVRHLVEVRRLLESGIALEGYYHWSLLDNFEWAEGFRPRFGLYAVDFATQARTLTEGGRVFGAIASAGTLTQAQVAEYGEGPLAPEPETPQP